MRENVPCPACGCDRWLELPAAKNARSRSTRCPPCGREARHGTVDEIAVERLLAHIPVRATRAEHQEAVTILTRHGLTAAVIAERIGVSQRTVERLRRRAA